MAVVEAVGPAINITHDGRAMGDQVGHGYSTHRNGRHTRPAGQWRCAIVRIAYSDESDIYVVQHEGIGSWAGPGAEMTSRGADYHV